MHTFVHENVKKFVEGFRYDAHPMGMLLASVGALSTFYPDAPEVKDEAIRYSHVIRLIAKMPTLAAFAYRHNMGQPYVYPDNELDYPGNFLSMMYKMSEIKYEPDPRLSRALDVLFILHADHEQNCSTNAVRAVGSSQVDPYSRSPPASRRSTGRCTAARTSRRSTCCGASARSTTSGLPQGRQGRQGEAPGLRPPRLQELRPARAIIRKHLDEVYEVTGKSPLLEIATELEKRALDDEYFTSRKLYPNVDYYSGLIYEAMGLDAGMFPSCSPSRARAAGSPSGSR
jgi:citrate synthase